MSSGGTTKNKTDNWKTKAVIMPWKAKELNGVPKAP